MSQNFLKSITTLFLILSSLSIAIAIIVDTDGDLLRNGGQYYIIPQSKDIIGGFSLTTKPKTLSSCPPYITLDKNKTSPGIPVTISSPAQIAYISTGLVINIVFEDVHAIICEQSLGWMVVLDETTGKLYVAAGESGVLFNPMESFKIVKGDDKNVYKIKNVAYEKEVGVFKKDGLLGITNEIPLPVKFKKAQIDFLPM